MKIKKRIASVLTAGMIAACSAMATANLSASAANPFLRGDVNLDGTIDLVDAIKLNQFLAGIIAVEDLRPLDMDTNYVVSSNDYKALMQLLVHG